MLDNSRRGAATTRGFALAPYLQVPRCLNRGGNLWVLSNNSQSFFKKPLEVRGQKRGVALRRRHENLGHGQHAIKRVCEGSGKF